jgi:hypothetical protein
MTTRRNISSGDAVGADRRVFARGPRRVEHFRRRHDRDRARRRARRRRATRTRRRCKFSATSRPALERAGARMSDVVRTAHFRRRHRTVGSDRPRARRGLPRHPPGDQHGRGDAPHRPGDARRDRGRRDRDGGRMSLVEQYRGARPLQHVDERQALRARRDARRRRPHARPRRLLRIAARHAEPHPVGRPHLALALHAATPTIGQSRDRDGNPIAIGMHDQVLYATSTSCAASGADRPHIDAGSTPSRPSSSRARSAIAA